MKACLCLLIAVIGGCAERGPRGGPGDERFAALLAPAVISPQTSPGRYVNEVGRRLMTAARALRDERQWPDDASHPADWMLRDVNFALVDGGAPNAFTSGGAQVYVTNSLLRACASEDDFAAALACAYAHLICRHAPLFAPPAEPYAEAKLALEHVEFHFTLAQQEQADELAVWLLARGGWSVARYSAVIELCGGHASPISRRLSDVQRRIDALPATWADWAQPPVADRKRFAANQLAADGQGAAGGADTASLKRARLIVAAFSNGIAGEDTARQLRARAELEPSPPLPEDNPWGKGLPPPRER